MRGSLKKALMANLNAQMFGDTDEKILMSSYYVHGVLKAGILKWFAIPFSSGPHSVWITINCGEFFKRWEYQTTWPASWETYMQVRKQQLELGMEQQTGSK